jgi:hypothetical protein
MKRTIMMVAALVFIGFTLPAQAQVASGNAVDAKTQSSGGKTWKTIYQDLKDAGLYVLAVDERNGIITMGTLMKPMYCGGTEEATIMRREDKALKLIDEWMAGTKPKQKQQIVISKSLITRAATNVAGIHADGCTPK